MRRVALVQGTNWIRISETALLLGAALGATYFQQTGDVL